MPLDPTLVPALEQELAYARNLKPGGQPVDEGRIAAIEEQIRLNSNGAASEPEAGDASNDSTDYATTDDVHQKRAAKDAEKRAAKDAAKENAMATRAAETAAATDTPDETPDGDAPVEVADAD
jgi:hypothetical protein